MKNTLLVLFFTLITFYTAAQGSDPEALKKANRMIERMGGHSVWANAKHLYVKEIVYPLNLAGPITAEFWRGYSKPAHLEKLVGPQTDRMESRNEKSAWTSNNGEVTILSDEDFVEEMRGQQQEPYQMFYRIARRDSTLVIKLVGENRLDLYEKSGRKLCWFIIDKECAPVSWGNIYRRRLNQHVYGPLKSFGSVNMPAWGASIDGAFRFEYVEVKPMAEEFTAPAPPKSKK